MIFSAMGRNRIASRRAAVPCLRRLRSPPRAQRGNSGPGRINAYAEGETASYPTLCKGRYLVEGRPSYLFEEPTSLSAVHLLPELMAAGVTALKIEGRQRGRAYVAKVVAALRRAVDAAVGGEPVPVEALAPVMEGGRQTAGAYEKAWR